MDRPPPIAWPVPDAFPALGPAEVHVWCTWLDDPQTSGPQAGASLSADEAARGAAFHFEAGRRRYVAAHAMTRGLLAHYLDLAPGDLAFVAGPSGKPALAGDAGLQFNLSHSGPLALLAVARDQPVGVDVEQRWELPDLALLEERMFTPAALRRQQRLAPEPRLRGFYRRWTQLEAVGKCRGTGLELEAASGGTEHLAPADPADGFTGCVACTRAPTRLEFFQFAQKVQSYRRATTGVTHPIIPGLPHRNPALARLSSS